MTRVMRDSTTPADIPLAGTDMVAGYVNGSYAWTDSGWARFPNVPAVRIDVSGQDPSADVLDVEPGDATPQGAVRWMHKKLALTPTGIYPPVFYVNRAQRPALIAALHADGFEVGKDYKLWIATLDGTKGLPNMTGVIAIQWASTKQTGHHYDESIVFDDTWKPGPKPKRNLTAADVQAITKSVIAALPKTPLPPTPPSATEIAKAVADELAARLRKDTP